MKKLFSALLLLILFCCFSHKTNSTQIDKDKFFIKELNYRDFSLQKLMDIGFDEDLALLYHFRYDTISVNLKLVDSLDYIYVKERKHCSSSEFYYYSVIDTTNYYSYVYFYYKDYVKAFVLVNYDKSGKYIDDVVISSFSGSDGFFSDTDGVFINDSVIIRTDREGNYEWIQEKDTAYEIVESEIKLKILVKKDGHIHTDTIR